MEISQIVKQFVKKRIKTSSGCLVCDAQKRFNSRKGSTQIRISGMKVPPKLYPTGTIPSTLSYGCQAYSSDLKGSTTKV